MEVLKVFVKQVEGKEGKSFEKKLGAFNVEGIDDSLIVDVRVTRACEPKFTSDMYRLGLHYPIALGLNEDDYFIKDEPYLTKEGVESTKFVLFLRDYQTIEQSVYQPKNYEKKTLTSILKDRQEAR